MKVRQPKQKGKKPFSCHSIIPSILMLAVLFASPSLLALAAPTAAPIIATVDSAGHVGEYSSLVLNSSGIPVISYLDSTNYDLKLAVCGNTTCTSGNTLTTVDSEGWVGWHNALVLNSSGNPVISYYDMTNNNLKLAVCGNATCTSGNILTTVDSSGVMGRDISLVLNSSGNPVISYYDMTNRDLKLAVCSNTTCTSKTFTTVDSPGDLGSETSLALNSSGNPIISYYDDTNGDLKLAVCGNATCTSKSITTVDSSGDVGRFTSLALNSSGNAVISYLDDTNQNLKLAVCGNATCTSKTITTVDSDEGMGYYSSLELNSSGYPIISYYDHTNDDLKLAVCENATCTSKSITVISSAGNVGQYNSLALNSDEDPVISYYDGSNRNLKLATRSRQDLEISKDNDSAGAGTVGEAFNWHLHIRNTGDLPVVFHHGQRIFIDDLPAGPTYGIPAAGSFNAVSNSGNVYCYTVNDSSGETLICEAAGGDVIIGELTGAFDVAVSAISNTAGTLTNPAGVCRIDPDNIILEYNESNNLCNSDTLNIFIGPEMDVLGNGISIINGNATPSSANNTEFGEVDVFSGTQSQSFSIENNGDSALTLSGTPLVAISGASAGDFSLSTPATTPVAAAGNTTFEITFDPSAAGLRTATVSISNDDANENPYTFDIQGTGTDPSMLTAPLIAPLDGSAVGSTSMQVVFNQPVLSDASSGSATNIDNYLLVERGTNNIIDTVSCLAGAGGDDIAISILTVDYDPMHYLATLNAGTLAPGYYRLFVCGTTSIEGLSGNELNGGLMDSTSSFRVISMPSSGGSSISILPATGFAPQRTTLLPDQLAQAAYSSLGELWLDIPSLGLQKSIIGVPKTTNGWDLTWLGSEIGYLDGSAFPTLPGNTVLTGHVYDANGIPGPFVDLDKLSWGKKIAIHSRGSIYMYEVRSISLWTNPNNMSAINRHEDYDWITLITCRGYDEKTDTYKWRTVVRAVLIEVSAE